MMLPRDLSTADYLAGLQPLTWDDRAAPRHGHGVNAGRKRTRLRMLTLLAT
jgi:hypothetical protein